MTKYSLDILLSQFDPVLCSLSGSNCYFLTCIQVSQEADQVVWYSHLFQNFPQFILIHTVKGFGIVNEAEVDVFLELTCFFDDPVDVGDLISGSSAFSKTSLNIWKFTIHVLMKPGLENFECCFTSVWDECNGAVVWAFFVIAFFGDWNENCLFPVLWPVPSFSNLLAYWVQHSIILVFKIAQLEFHHLHYLCLSRCFPRPSWPHSAGCLTVLIIWIVKIFLVQFFCVFLTPLLNVFCFH